MNDRTCGNCTACCTVMGVVELKKIAEIPCKHCGEGCTIYPKRPPSCKAFKCLWLQGWGLEHDRPDISGVLLDRGRNRPGLGQIITAKPTASGSLETQAAANLINEIAQTYVVWLVLDGVFGRRRSMVGPPEKQKAIQKALNPA